MTHSFPSLRIPPPFCHAASPAYPMRTSLVLLPVASPCLALAMPFLFVGHGIKCMMVAAMTMTFASMLCYFVCSCVCVLVPMCVCASVDGLFPLGFSHLVCLYACLCVGRGGGVAWIDAWVKVSLCVSVCECVTAFFGFWLPRFVCVCGFECVYERVCVNANAMPKARAKAPQCQKDII